MKIEMKHIKMNFRHKECHIWMILMLNIKLKNPNLKKNWITSTDINHGMMDSKETTIEEVNGEMHTKELFQRDSQVMKETHSPKKWSKILLKKGKMKTLTNQMVISSLTKVKQEQQAMKSLKLILVWRDKLLKIISINILMRHLATKMS